MCTSRRPFAALAEPAASPDWEVERFGRFSAIFAVAIILYHVEQRLWTGWVDWLELAAASLVLHPRSRHWGLVVLIPTVLGQSVWALPAINTNRLVQGLVALLIFLAAAVAYWHTRDRKAAGATAARAALPGLRSLLLVVYAFSAWHKLNTDFLDPAISCGPELYRAFSRVFAERTGFALFPQGMLVDAVIVGTTLALECAIPLLLLVPRLRKAGAVVGLGFHYLLGVGLFLGFSATMVALLSLFLPLQAQSGVRGTKSARRRISPWLLPAAMGVLVVVGAHRPSLVFHATWAIWLLAGVAAAWWLGRRARFAAADTFAWRMPAAVALVPLATAVNGLCPYLGLQTEGCFAMYSNLRTEGGGTNHLLIPRPLALFPYQTDLVQVVASSDSALAELARTGRLIPWVKLQMLVEDRHRAGAPALSLRLLRGGDLRLVTDTRTDPAFHPPSALWERKLLRFREILPRDANTCSH